MSGNYAGNRNKLEMKNLKGRIGETEFSGRASMIATGKKRVEIELASPRLDLTQFTAGDTGAKPKPQPKEAERKFVFDEAPLPPLDNLKVVDARVHLALAEVKLGTGSCVMSTALLWDGKLNLEGRVRAWKAPWAARSAHARRRRRCHRHQRLRQACAQPRRRRRDRSQRRAADGRGGAPPPKVPRRGRWRQAPMGRSW
jgi:hypothetical protein